MNELDLLYQQVILDHNRRPRNYGCIEGTCGHADGHNPLCGDQVRVYVVVRDGLLADIKFEGKGCAISQSSASMMTEAVKGKTTTQVQKLFKKFHALVAESEESAAAAKADQEPPELGKLEVFEGVREFPMRVKCATLAWHTLQAALQADKGSATLVSTE